MKLNRLKIYNFGKLSGYETYFNDGVNTIREDNGWGKTTLLVFIRVMFYGFKNERAKTVEGRERAAYDPWGGGNYGGEIVFENDGKTYLLQRIFGKKPAEDTFTLKDTATDLISTDFTENIGQELFKLNMDSFERTIFIGHNDCITEANGDITANIGNLTDDTDDVNNYEKVMKELNDIINKYHDKNVKGRVTQLNNDITELQSELRASEMLDQTLAMQLDKKVSTEREIEKAEAFSKGLLEERQRTCEKMELKGDREKYESLKADYENRQKLYNDARADFSGEIPTKEDLENLNELIAEYNRAEGGIVSSDVKRKEVIEKCKLTEESVQIFQFNVIRYRELLKILNDKLARFAEKKAEFYELPKEKKLPMFILLIPGILMLAGVIVLFFDLPMLLYILGSGVALLGLVFILLSFVFGFRVKESPEKQKLRAELHAMKEEKVALEAKIEEKKLELTEKLFEVDIIFDETTVDAELAELKNDVLNYYKAKSSDMTYSSIGEKIDSIFAKYGYEEVESYSKQLAKMIDSVSVIESAYEEMKAAEARKLEFEQQNDIQSLLNGAGSKSLRTLSDIDNDINAVNSQILRHNELLKDYNRQIEELNTKLEERSNTEDTLKQKKAELSKAQNILNTARLTEQYLEEAKALLTAKYKNPLEIGFKKYFEVFSGLNSGDYKIDANAKLKINECDLDREISALSSGRQDIAWLCLRMAFADAMYESNKPFIIMDDPFINLDDTSVEGGREFLKQIANEYQLIYVTCSKSRE